MPPGSDSLYNGPTRHFIPGNGGLGEQWNVASERVQVASRRVALRGSSRAVFRGGISPQGALRPA